MIRPAIGRLSRTIRNKRDGVRQIWCFDNRWALLADRLIPGRSISTYAIGSLRMSVDHASGDATGIREVFGTPMYRSFVSQMDLPAGLVVLDIGAHIGSFTLLLESMGFDVADAILVELNPTTCGRLRHNVSTNLRGRCRVVHAAINGDGRSVAVALGGGSTGDSIEHGSPESTATSDHRISGATLDQLVAGLPDPIDICKIDVEGAEYDVFAHPHHDRLRRCRYLLIEIHDRAGTAPRKLIEQISALGFTLQSDSSTAVGVHAFRNSALS